VRLICFTIFFSLFAAGSPRVISTSPQLTEVLFQLGKGESIIGTTSFSDYPNEAKKIPVIGPLFMPGLEATIGKTPDWVILDNSAPLHEYKAQLERFSISHLRVGFTSVSALFSESQKILSLVYGEKENERLSREIAEWKKITSRKKQKIRGLILAWYDPFILVGHSTFLSDLLSYAGIENIAQSDWKLDYPQVSTEWAMKQAPDVILYLQFDSQVPAALERAVQKTWPRNPPTIVPLESSLFPRASFTALRSLPLLLDRVRKKDKES
jgi:ABC-type Fe3+-hydroxamate transport system substrate-binding protein